MNIYRQGKGEDRSSRSMEHDHEMSSLRAAVRRKKSSVGLSCCFNRRSFDADFDSSPGAALPPAASPHRSTSSSSSSSWMIKSNRPTHDQLLSSDHVKGKYRSFISRMSRHRRHSSADQFSYDPLSYALNFEDDEPPSSSSVADESAVRGGPKNFTSRLPASPPMTPISNMSSAARRATLLDPHEHYFSRTAHDRRPDQDPKAVTNHELRRGFEALSASMRESAAERRTNVMKTGKSSVV